MKLEQISQGEGFVGIVIDLKHTYLQNSNLKDDGGIIVINKLYNQRFNFFSYYHWIQKLVCTNYKIILKPIKGKSQLTHMNHTL
jgi:GH15 family glucan-1,4-alpha-glucosidase